MRLKPIKIRKMTKPKEDVEIKERKKVLPYRRDEK